LEEHLRVNTIGPVIIFQALFPLLLQRQTRKFVPISTGAASIGVQFPPPLTAYGSSKAALNYITKSIHKEHSEEGLIAFPIHPGMVDTDMGKGAAHLFGLERLPMTPAESAEAVYNIVDTATAERSGKFMSYDGTEIPW
jgi:norsolorinic acid ketoreductase